jgi:hypothetical protein
MIFDNSPHDGVNDKVSQMDLSLEKLFLETVNSGDHAPTRVGIGNGHLRNLHAQAVVTFAGKERGPFATQ